MPAGKKIQRAEIYNDFVVVTLSDRTLIWLPRSVFTLASSGATAGVAPKKQQALAIANDADTFDSSCDAKGAVGGGANSPTPVALVDLESFQQVATVPYASRRARSRSVTTAARCWL